MDTGLPHTQPAMVWQLAEIGGPDPDLIILTHAHSDHSGGVHGTEDAAMNGDGVMLPPVAEDYAVTAQSIKRLSELDFEHSVFGQGPAIVSGASGAWRTATATL